GGVLEQLALDRLDAADAGDPTERGLDPVQFPARVVDDDDGLDRLEAEGHGLHLELPDLLPERGPDVAPDCLKVHLDARGHDPERDGDLAHRKPSGPLVPALRAPVRDALVPAPPAPPDRPLAATRAGERGRAEPVEDDAAGVAPPLVLEHEGGSNPRFLYQAMENPAPWGGLRPRPFAPTPGGGWVYRGEQTLTSTSD